MDDLVPSGFRHDDAGAQIGKLSKTEVSTAKAKA
jgi:hypothetical protein